MKDRAYYEDGLKGRADAQRRGMKDIIELLLDIRDLLSKEKGKR